MGLFSPADTGRAGDSGHQLKCKKIPSELKTFLYNEGGKTLALATQRGYGVTISGDIQSPAGRGPGQTALADTV